MSQQSANTDLMPTIGLSSCCRSKESKGGEKDGGDIRDADRPRCNTAKHGECKDPVGTLPHRSVPRHERAEPHQKGKHNGNRQCRPHVVAGIHCRTLAHEPRDQRHRHTEEHENSDKDEEQHAEQNEEAAAAVFAVDRPLRKTIHLTHKDDESKEQDNAIRKGNVKADVRPRKGVYGEVSEDTAAGQERPIENERIGEDRREMDEIECAAPRTCDGDQMEQDAGEQPRYERGVLHGIPAPVAAPAEHLVCPVAADEDACAEKRPRDERPAAHRCEKVPVCGAAHHTLKRVNKGNGEERIADKDDRRMHGHPRILQQRVHPVPVGHNMLGGSKGTLDEYENDEHRRQEMIDDPPRRRQTVGADHIRTNKCVNEEPEEERALLPCPECRDLVDQREIDGGVARHIRVAEIIGQDDGKENG